MNPCGPQSLCNFEKLPSYAGKPTKQSAKKTHRLYSTVGHSPSSEKAPVTMETDKRKVELPVCSVTLSYSFFSPPPPRPFNSFLVVMETYCFNETKTKKSGIIQCVVCSKVLRPPSYRYQHIIIFNIFKSPSKPVIITKVRISAYVKNSH